MLPASKQKGQRKVAAPTKKPLHRRPGVTVAELQEKRTKLHDQLQSEAHQATVLTRDYGEHDPRIAPFPPCTCEAPGRLQRDEKGKWMACCSRCEKRIPSAQQHDWAACLEWCLLNLEQLDYQQLPLFGLEGLDRQAAKSRLTSIYNDLILRCQIACLDLALYQRTRENSPPGLEYYERICAYRDWAKFALRLIKIQ